MDSLFQVIVCAIDPNDKNVSPKGITDVGYIKQSQNELEYLIRFQIPELTRHLQLKLRMNWIQI